MDYKKNITSEEANHLRARLGTALAYAHYGDHPGKLEGDSYVAYRKEFDEKWEELLQWVVNTRAQAQLIDALLDDAVALDIGEDEKIVFKLP